MSRKTDRRDFLKVTGLAGVGYWVAGGIAPRESRAANERIRFACIGVGGKGDSDSSDCGKFGDIVAICDVDDETLNKKGSQAPFANAAKFNDYRKMLDEVGKNVDAVTVSTPDHTHAPASAMAMRMGKACFTQKPLTHSIYEARKLGEIAREMKVATQMGNQGTAETSLRRAAAVTKSGVLGPVTEVHVWTNRPVSAQPAPVPAKENPPSSLHWDLWLGPAPYRDYGKGYHTFAWRGWWDFGTGALGDMACHTVNMPFMALNLRDPISVQAESSGHNRNSYPKWSVIEFAFDKLGDRPACKLFWYDGGKKVDKTLLDGEMLSDTGVLIIGEKGKLFAPGDYCEKGHKVLGGPEDPKVEFVKSPGHFDEYARAIKGGEPAMSNFPDYAGPLSETILLGNLAVWAANESGVKGKKIEWDAKNLKPTNAPEVESIVKRTYREGYSL